MSEQNSMVPVNKSNEIQELCKNPTLFSEYVKGITTRIEESHTRLEEINGRGWWKRKFSSTTKDLSAEMVEHSSLMSDLFTLLQVASYMTKGNSALLLGLMDSLKNTADANDKEGGFLDMTKSYLQALLDESKSASIRENAIKKLLVNSIQLNKDYKDLKKKQEDFKKEINSNISNQYRQIRKTNTSFQYKIEKRQSKSEEKVQEKQTFFEDKLKKRFEIIESRISDLEKNNFWKSAIYHILIGILSTVSFVFSVFLLCR